MNPPSLDPGLVEEECCGSCFPPPAPQAPSDASLEEAGLSCGRLCKDGEDVSLTAGEGKMEASAHNLNSEDVEKEQRFSFQIFPDPVEVVLSPNTALNSLDHGQEKERLPSIVVEPTELSEVESGELRWPPETMDMEEDEEDLFLEQCIPPANIADWGEEEEVGEETLILLTPQPGLTLIDLQSDAFRDDTPTLPPSSAPALN
ncbi:uncharacterized protein lbhl [Takifugu rubripes]|uniref:Uncharacterized LOC101075680 n=1 Tax=Takifugu rubripes TaxID=31033 RepID=A0A3B5KPV6_TAKRU|nr:uncharacterized protein LOC101075680 [Takifugu rubripes]|eukprot:XP_011606577.1 PREDICTED: uncharacterized protein LOC101075680 [Takifugu rubripes]